MQAAREQRSERLAAARVYFVCEARPNGRDPRPLLDAAIRGGAGIVQLRDKELSDEELIEAARPFREAADAGGALFILNDRPDLVAGCRADGVHVGQDDMPVAEARAMRPATTRWSASPPTPRPRSTAASSARRRGRPTSSASGPSGRRRPRRAGPRPGSA